MSTMVRSGFGWPTGAMPQVVSATDGPSATGRQTGEFHRPIARVSDVNGCGTATSQFGLRP